MKTSHQRPNDRLRRTSLALLGVMIVLAPARGFADGEVDGSVPSPVPPPTTAPPDPSAVVSSYMGQAALQGFLDDLVRRGPRPEGAPNPESQRVSRCPDQVIVSNLECGHGFLGLSVGAAFLLPGVYNATDQRQLGAGFQLNFSLKVAQRGRAFFFLGGSFNGTTSLLTGELPWSFHLFALSSTLEIYVALHRLLAFYVRTGVSFGLGAVFRPDSDDERLHNEALHSAGLHLSVGLQLTFLGVQMTVEPIGIPYLGTNPDENGPGIFSYVLPLQMRMGIGFMW